MHIFSVSSKGMHSSMKDWCFYSLSNIYIISYIIYTEDQQTSEFCEVWSKKQILKKDLNNAFLQKDYFAPLI